MTIAWVFPGQGSQKIGMADEVLSLPGAQQRFELASNLIGRDLLKVSRGLNSEVPFPNDLNDTRNTQPAMFVVESLLVDSLRRKGEKPAFVAGHSLGEIVALYAADVFDVNTALKLLKSRSELMASAQAGAMTAVMGFDRKELDRLIEASKDVVVANDNSLGQVVLSGAPEALSELTESLGCKRAIPLNVSGAFHSPFMNEPAINFEKELDNVQFDDATIPVISNADPKPTRDSLLLKDRLKKQMITGVRWRETMDVMVESKINEIVEIGPGNVLSGLAKRSLKDVTISRISNASDLET